MHPDDILIAPGSLVGGMDLVRLFGAHSPARPLEVEVGMGKGRFLVESARRHPERDFIGIEHSRRLVRTVSERILRAGHANVRLYHGNAKDALLRLLPTASVSRLHVYFPDPWPKRRHAKHRFFAPPMAAAIARVLVPGGDVLLATDHDPYMRGAIVWVSTHPAFVRTTVEEAFAGQPTGGFEAIFESQGVPVLRARWERRADSCT